MIIFNTPRNLQDDDSEVPVLPTSGEEIASKGAKKTFLKGPGVDERYFVHSKSERSAMTPETHCRVTPSDMKKSVTDRS